MAIASYQIDPRWYTDNGVTDHITVDLDKLSIKEKYHGKDHVQVVMVHIWLSLILVNLILLPLVIHFP